MSQAKKIRDVVLDLFIKPETVNPFMISSEEILVNSKKFEAYKYSELKNYLITNCKFTEGAVTGALQTITTKVENIYKTKTNDGVYYFYSENNEVNESSRKDEFLVESEDLKNLERKIDSVYQEITNILIKAAKGQYKDIKEIDVNHLRNLLRYFDDAKGVLKEYKTEKWFQDIDKITTEKLPF